MSNVEVREVWQGESAEGGGPGLQISVQTLDDGTPLNRPIYFKWGKLGGYVSIDEASKMQAMLADAIAAARTTAGGRL